MIFVWFRPNEYSEGCTTSTRWRAREQIDPAENGLEEFLRITVARAFREKNQRLALLQYLYQRLKRVNFRSSSVAIDQDRP